VQHAWRAAGGATHLQGRGEVVHDFQAALAEELSVAAGESVRPGPTLILLWQVQAGMCVLCCDWSPQGIIAAVHACARPGTRRRRCRSCRLALHAPPAVHAAVSSFTWALSFALTHPARNTT